MAINKYLTGLLLIAVSTFFFTLSYQIIHVGQHVSNALMAITDEAQEAKQVTDHLNKTVTQINYIIRDTDDLVIGLNKPKTGTIAVLDHDLGAIRLAVDNVNQAALQERFFLEKTQPEEVAKLNQVVDTTNDTIKKMQPVLGSTNAEIVQLQLTTAQIDKLISDPELIATINNVEATTEHVNATSADVQKVVSGYLHPTWAHRIYGYCLDIAHALNPL